MNGGAARRPATPCPTCYTSHRVKANDRMYPHQHNGQPCPGSDQPAAVAALAGTPADRYMALFAPGGSRSEVGAP